MKIIASMMVCMLTLLALRIEAQVLPLTNEAAKLCQQKQYAQALAKADAAIASTAENSDAYAWYVHGFVHKEMYKDTEVGLRQSAHRQKAEQSLMQSLKKSNAEKHESMVKLALKYLASTYYNDALQCTQTITANNEKEARNLFEDFKRLMSVAEPNTNFAIYEKELNKSIGQRYFSLWQMDTDNLQLRDLAAQQYESILSKDNTDSDALYNIAVIYYNQAVFMYRKLGPDMDMFDSITLQEEASKLIRTKALPNMERAYEIAPEKGEIVRGIMMMHRALDHEKDVEFFKKEIERLINEGKIKSDRPKQ
jgi:hypothetical protein